MALLLSSISVMDKFLMINKNTSVKEENEDTL